MDRRTLGRTGIKVSDIGLGTWAFSSTSYGKAEDEESIRAIRSAYDQGVDFFDTAPLYGTAEQDGVSEIILGRGLEGIRDDVLISTKFGRKPSDGCKPFFNGAYAIQSVEESLWRLGTDHVDVLFFHSPFSPDEINDDVWEGLATLKASGKVRVVGHSISMFEDTEAMSREWAAERKIDVVQVVYSLMNRQAEALINDFGRQGVGVVARESLANGFLTGALKPGHKFPEGNLNNRYSQEEIDERIHYADQFRFLVRDDVQSLAQAALRWVLDNENVSTVLTGAINQAQLLDSCAASAAQGFAAEEHQKVDALHVRDYAAA